MIVHFSQAYASILYLRRFTDFRIIVRGKDVEQFSIMDDLKLSKKVTYSPQVGPTSKEVGFSSCEQVFELYMPVVFHIIMLDWKYKIFSYL